MSKISIGGSFFAVIVAILAVAFFAAQQSETTLEDVGEQIALKIIQFLPRKSNRNVEDDKEEQQQEESEVKYTKESIFNPVGSYNAKNAMQARYEGLRETCIKYSDFMRPERLMKSTVPKFESMIFHTGSNMAFCTLDKVAKKSFETLFFRAREGQSRSQDDRLKSIKLQYPRVVKDMKKAIIVRHPMERLISAYR